jgi:hypothetical protein
MPERRVFNVAIEIQMTASPKPPSDGGEDRREPSTGDTRVAREPDEGAPRLPHERDESADSQTTDNGSQRQIGKQALEDLENGLVDTGRKPELDKVYDENLRTGGGEESGAREAGGGDAPTSRTRGA